MQISMHPAGFNCSSFPIYYLAAGLCTDVFHLLSNMNEEQQSESKPE
jgi:hypothetical protein